MTVAQLIERLGAMPSDATVYAFTEDYGSRFVWVEQVELEPDGDVCLGEA